MLVLIVPFTSLATAADDAAGLDLFESKIRPALIEHCYECHSAKADKLKGGLRLDSRDGILRGGDSGAAIKPGDVDGSRLIEAIRYEIEDGEMPPDGKLSAGVIADFENWVTLGAPWPKEKESAANQPAKTAEKTDWNKARQFWAFQKPHQHEAPSVKNKSWSAQPLDPFVLAKIEAAGLAPSEPTDQRTLIRRVTLDLIGLPPTPEEVTKFLADKSPQAYASMVDRLLASPRHGERWARLWLDVARYGEGNAHTGGGGKAYPNAYRYRDWVIRALNEDLPYDRFVKLQLAADVMPKVDRQDFAALGLLGLGPQYYNNKRLDVMADEWEDRVDTVARGLLGLTVACARCHDHKYDPIKTDDYYALAGVFAGTSITQQNLGDKGVVAHAVKEGKPTDLTVFLRGNVNHKGPVVKRRFLTVLSASEPVPFTKGSGRLELAEAIADETNPLTARVIVNRVWSLYFGRGLVDTPSNFGAQGSRPSHPKLLDDLAVRFAAAGWSLKKLHREIVLSSTYRQSSRASQDKRQKDAANRWLSRMPRRRLGVESWRDSILAVSGQLDLKVGGPSVNLKKADNRRRTIYAQISRSDLDRTLQIFDFPDPNVHSARRALTTTALQKLFVMNSPFMAKQAEMLAARLTKSDGNHAAQVRTAYALLFARQPSEEELKLAVDFLTETLSAEKSEMSRWQQYAQILLASNELRYTD